MASLFRCDLRGANLREANLAGARLVELIYNEQTLWPKGFDPVAADVGLAK